jgi:hypothetical protein
MIGTRTRSSLVLGALALLVTASGAAAALTVDSPRLEQVTCEGIRVRQTGLPAQRLFVVEVTNPETGQEFARQKVLSTEAGSIDARITAGFEGARQLAVEVEANQGNEEVEFAEAIHEFDQPCPAAQASSSTPRGTNVVLPMAVGAIILVGAGWAIRTALPRRG